jgi:predicted transposase/invertase (TIGR01784 family)
LDDVQRLFFIELKKFDLWKANEQDLLNVWLTFLKDPTHLPQSALKIEEVHKAFDRLVFISSDEKMRLEAQARQDALNDYYSGITTAERMGKAEGKLETALAMLADGISVDKVSLYTGLPIEDVNAIASHK